MRAIAALPLMLTIAACSGGTSNRQDLQEAANQSTPEAAQVLNSAAENGTPPGEALNEAARAQAGNTSTGAPPRMQARPNSAEQPNPPQAGQPPQKVPTNAT
jgi:hypothetical protein